MEALQPIGVTPVPLNTDRDVVEVLFLEHCWNKNLGFKELMLLALKKGRELQRLEDITEFADRIGAIRGYHPPKADETFPRERPRPDYAAEVDDPVRPDQSVMARQVNTALRISGLWKDG
jgi:hypothetical protein